VLFVSNTLLGHYLELNERARPAFILVSLPVNDRLVDRTLEDQQTRVLPW